MAVTLSEAAHEWLTQAKAGVARNRSGEVFKPKVLRDYESALSRYVLPSLGAERLDQVRRSDIQALVDRIAGVKKPSTVRNAVMPLRTVFRYAIQRDWVQINPTEDLAMPAVRPVRDRIATPDEAHALLEVLEAEFRGPWATAFYAGLRLGEIQALRWCDVADGVVRVRRSWDPKVGPVPPKSKAGIRTVPLIEPLRVALGSVEGKNGDALVFGRDATTAFSHNRVRAQAHKAWNERHMQVIGFHEARHTFASWLIAAGVDMKAVSTYVGHSSIATTMDIYGHLLPGNERTTGAKLEAFLTQATPSPTPQTGRGSQNARALAA